ncbi:hypothetical protein PAEPH01_1820 [Pancytospora epiphaga]|nr:hypothetical protein PAEPH01_1820 [Pancytospora epiphaga]
MKYNVYFNIENDCNNSIISDSTLIPKPSKENQANKPYSFPNYINKKINIYDFPWLSLKRVEYIHATEPETKAVYQEYKIYRSRILKDERTACMIRNIPNKYTSEVLLDYINETQYGSYDFFYLRIDFKNKCNVGYAFINFLSNNDVLSFYDRINGYKWKNHNSTKVAELTYASIQGIVNLKRKFKNSTVMLVEKAFRPKVFYTEGALKGKEKEEFE